MSEPYRADHVGSFLRPAAVKEARAAYRAGRLSLAQLQHIEDRAILAVLERQRRIGVDIFTDGELRRSGFQGPGRSGGGIRDDGTSRRSASLARARWDTAGAGHPASGWGDFATDAATD